MVSLYRPLGKSGLIVSGTSLGCNNLGRIGVATETQEGVDALIDAAIDAGITYFDIADMYGGAYRGQSEEMFAKALKGRRDQVVIGTKFGLPMNGANGEDYNARGSRWYIRRAVESSLRRLETDYIDLYHYHQPDWMTPIEETLEALDELVTEGKVRYIGASNFPAWMVAQADAVAKERNTQRFISVQNEYSLLRRQVEAEVTHAAEAHDVSLIPYYPLYNGLLTGKYSREHAPQGGRITKIKPEILENTDWDQLEAFSAFAKARGITETQVAFGWLLAQPTVDTVIAGATTAEQIKQNVEAATAWQPTPEDLVELDEIFSPVERYGRA